MISNGFNRFIDEYHLFNLVFNNLKYVYLNMRKKPENIPVNALNTNNHFKLLTITS